MLALFLFSRSLEKYYGGSSGLLEKKLPVPLFFLSADIFNIIYPFICENDIMNKKIETVGRTWDKAQNSGELIFLNLLEIRKNLTVVSRTQIAKTLSIVALKDTPNDLSSSFFCSRSSCVFDVD